MSIKELVLRRSGGCKFQSRGAEKLKLFMVVRQAEGTVRWTEDLRERQGVVMCMRSERHEGAWLWLTL